ncbi:MAG: ATP-binding protein [Clostridia bacterium]|nr:ATP-binding protein [Clostridia bacterium]
MLIKVVVDNFLSFNKETELTMIPSNKTRKKSEHKVKVKSTPMLKYAVVYGANASGKSNLIEVFQFIKYCVEKTIPIEAISKFCKTNKSNIDKPSLFELQFTVGNKFYAYGFSIVLNTRTIESEWLYELYQNGTQKTLFEREKGKKPVIGEDINLTDSDNAKLTTYLEDFEENSSSLFLTIMNRGKKYAYDSKLLFFKEVYEWISKNLIIVTPNTSLRSFEYYYDNASLSLISDLIKTFDTGITEVNVVEISMEELGKELPPPIFESIISDIKEKTEDEKNIEIKLSMRSDRSFFNIEVKKGQPPKITTISLKHGKSFYKFKYEEESDGTRRLFDLLDILLNKTNDTVYIVDEMERSLHPKLTSRFIELFDKIHLSNNMQLIFTTHESSIMDQKLFRRDEIWFVERNNENVSSIYSLDKFKERYDKKLSKAYLEGRYGAIPVFTAFKFTGE